MSLRIKESALTFDDVLLLPNYSNHLPKDVDTSTQITPEISLHIPLISAAMDTVTEHRLAVALAQLGGLGVIHKSMPIEEQAREVSRVKKFESGIVQEPITVSPQTTVSELLNIKARYNISGMPVIDNDKLVGIITSRDIRFETNLDAVVADLMTPRERLITVSPGAERDEILSLFKAHRVEKLLITDDEFQLCGMVTVKDLLQAQQHPHATKDSQGQLRVAAAVGTGPETPDRVRALIEAGADLIVVDTAHGHSQGVIDQVQWIRKHYPDHPIMAGNVATAEAALALAKAGANIIKVGIGPGSICTTRIIAGIGVPQVSAIANVVAALKKKPVSVIADGGIRFSGDVCKAIAAGAHAVMIGGLFAGTKEAPGDVVLYKGRSYKSYRGMGSIGAMSHQHGSSDRYFQDTENASKYVPEGIEGRVPFKGPLRNVVHQLIGGLRSSMGYTGSANINAMRTDTAFVQISAAGMRESHVHDVTITKEAPNYSMGDK